MIPALLALAGAIGLAACQWLIFVHAPVEASLGLPQKIFYIHLPLAWWALFSFFLSFLGSTAFLLKRKTALDDFSAACVETGLLMAGLALITGMIWARASWGVWWTWDPRLTSTLVMWFIYAACMILRGMEIPLERKRVICAAVGVAAFLDVPLVFFSARIFRSIHPAVFASRDGGLEPEMKLAVFACAICMGLFWSGLLWLRTRQISCRERLENLAMVLAEKSDTSDKGP